MLMAELKLVADLFVVSMRCDDPEALISVWVPLHKTNTHTHTLENPPDELYGLRIARLSIRGDRNALSLLRMKIYI